MRHTISRYTGHCYIGDAVRQLLGVRVPVWFAKVFELQDEPLGGRHLEDGRLIEFGILDATEL